MGWNEKGCEDRAQEVQNKGSQRVPKMKEGKQETHLRPQYFVKFISIESTSGCTLSAERPMTACNMVT